MAAVYGELPQLNTVRIGSTADCISMQLFFTAGG